MPQKHLQVISQFRNTAIKFWKSSFNSYPQISQVSNNKLLLNQIMDIPPQKKIKDFSKTLVYFNKCSYSSVNTSSTIPGQRKVMGNMKNTFSALIKIITALSVVGLGSFYCGYILGNKDRKAQQNSSTQENNKSVSSNSTNDVQAKQKSSIQEDNKSVSSNSTNDTDQNNCRQKDQIIYQKQKQASQLSIEDYIISLLLIWRIRTMPKYKKIQLIACIQIYRLKKLNLKREQQKQINKQVYQQMKNQADNESIQNQARNIQQLQEQRQNLIQKIKNNNNLDQISSINQQIFKNHLSRRHLKKIQKKNPNKKTKILIGQSGVGKTSLINCLFNMSLPVSLSDCTTNLVVVHEQSNIQIYDSPGTLGSFDIDKQDEFDVYQGFDEYYLLYDTSLKAIEDLIKILLHTKNIKIIFIRSKCDNFNQKQKRTLEQQLKVDRQLLQKWGYNSQQITIIPTSSEQLKSFKNEQLKNMLLK